MKICHKVKKIDANRYFNKNPKFAILKLLLFYLRILPETTQFFHSILDIAESIFSHLPLN